MTDNTQRFSDRAAAYVAGRPSYPAALFDWLLAKHSSGSKVADIGAGTGIFSVQLASAGYEVTAVEPSEPMRAQIPESIASVLGTAEDIPLPRSSFDLVTAAQAFHWFNQPVAIQEFGRILRPDGNVALVWNHRDRDTEVGTDYSALVEQYRKESIPHMGSRVNPTDYYEDLQFVKFSNPQFVTLSALLARVHSTSYLGQGAEIDAAFTGLFDRHAVNGVLKLPQYTELFYGKPAVPRNGG